MWTYMRSSLILYTTTFSSCSTPKGIFWEEILFFIPLFFLLSPTLFLFLSCSHCDNTLFFFLTLQHQFSFLSQNRNLRQFFKNLYLDSNLYLYIYIYIYIYSSTLTSFFSRTRSFWLWWPRSWLARVIKRQAVKKSKYTFFSLLHHPNVYYLN